MKKCRADIALKEQLNLENIELARALIMEGRVMVGDRKIFQSGELIKGDAVFRVKGELAAYVSRGAHKLRRALEIFRIDLAGKTCIDVGASTGGFTEVMLRAGAKRVYAVDVGYNLLDYRLRSDERVVCMERTNARFLTQDLFETRLDFGATDVSFISLKTVLPAALSVIRPGGRFVALVKPQFEAPREDVGDKGVVRNPEVHARVLDEIIRFLPEVGWKAVGLDYSPIRGPEGNIEFLLDMVEGDNPMKSNLKVSIEATIESAYEKFFKSSS